MIKFRTEDPQFAFDIVVAHLKTLPYRAVDEFFTTCAYIDDEGHYCAASVLLDATDDQRRELDSRLDATGIVDQVHEGYVERSPILNLISELQNLHDNRGNWNPNGFSNWPAARSIATRFGLEYRE